MLDINKTLPSARTLAENNSVRIKGESAGYRKARTALLAEEIELRRHIERIRREAEDGVRSGCTPSARPAAGPSPTRPCGASPAARKSCS